MKKLLFLFFILKSEAMSTPKSLSFLYTTPSGKFFNKIITKGTLNKFTEFYVNSILSRPLIKPFIKKNNVDSKEFLLPVEEYKTFNQFFIRKLNPEARIIDFRENIIISPVDGALFIIPNISQADTFFVKSKSFTLESFLQNKELANYYENGTMLIFRLAPRDYHWFHFPTDCIPSEALIIPGIFDSVNPIVYKSGKQPLITNKRHLILLETESFASIAMIPVGALFVGTIVETYKPNIHFNKSTEAGYFTFGGSTVVLLFQQNTIKIPQILIDASLQGIETPVKMGEAIAIKN